MKLHLPKQLFTALLAAITLAAPAAGVDDVLYVSDDTALTEKTFSASNTNRVLYNNADDDGSITNTTDITLGDGASVWVGPGTANSTSASKSGTHTVITLSGKIAGNAGTTLKFNEYASNDSSGNAIYRLTNAESTFDGIMTLDRGEGDKADVQLSMAGVGEAFDNVEIQFRTGGDRILSIEGNTTLGGLSTDGGPTARVTSNSADNVLTLNVGSGKNFTYAGAIGSGSYYNSTNSADTTQSTSLQLVKEGAGSQTIDGTVNLSGLTVNEGTLTFSGSNTTLSGTVTNNATLNLAGFTVAEEATVSFSGTGTTTLSGTIINNSTLELSGSNSSGIIKTNAAVTKNADNTVTHTGATINNSGHIDMSGLYIGSGNAGKGDVDWCDKTAQYTSLINSIVGGTVLLNSGDLTLQLGGGSGTKPAAVDFRAVYTVEKSSETADDGSFTLANYNNPTLWRVSEGGGLNVNKTLRIANKQDLLIAGGSVTAGDIKLAHDSNNNPGATLTISSGSLKTGFIRVEQHKTADKQTKITMTGGSLEFTTGNAITVEDKTTAPEISITGGTLKSTVCNWTLDATGWNKTPGISNVTIDGGNTKGITLKSVNLGGTITNNATAENTGLALENVTVSGSGITFSGDGATTLSGTLDFSGATLTTESAFITLGTGASLTINAGSIFKFGALEAGTEYKFIGASDGSTLRGWESESITAEQIYINGAQLSSSGYRINTSGGVFSFSQLISSLTWTGSANNDLWSSTSQNWITDLADPSAYVNAIDTSFTSDATATVTEAITTGNLTIAAAEAETGLTVTLNTAEGGSLAVASGKTLSIGANSTLNSSLGIDVSDANVSMGTGASWNLTGTAQQNLTKAQLDSVTAMKIDKTASLTVDATAAEALSTINASKLTGTGTVALSMNNNTSNGLKADLSNFTGTIQLGDGAAGDTTDRYNSTEYLIYTGSNINTSATISLLNGGGLAFSGTTSTAELPEKMTNALVVSNGGSAAQTKAGSTVHVDDGVYAEISGDISGEGQLFKKGAGTLSLSGDTTETAEIALKVMDGTLNLGGTPSLTYLGVGGGSSVADSTILNITGTVSANQLRMGEEGHAAVNIKSGGSLTINGAVNGNSTDRSLLLTHWGQASNSTLTLDGGNLTSTGARMFLSWTGTGTFKANSGEANLLGIDFLAQSSGKRGNFYLGDESNGAGSARVNIGSAGISNIDSADVAIKLGEGTLGALADWVMSANTNNAGNVQLIGTTKGTVFNTQNPTPENSTGHTITINASLSGSGKLVKDGLGTLALSGANTYSGGTTIKAGTVTTQNASALGTGGVEMTGGELNVAEGIGLVLGGALTAAADSTLALNNGSSLTLGAASTIAGTVTGAGNIASNYNTTFSGAVSGWTGSFTNGAAMTLTFDGSANAVNAAITQTTGNLDLTVGTTADATFGGAVTANQINVNQSTTFNGAVTATKMKVASSMSVTFAGAVEHQIEAIDTGSISNINYVVAGGASLNVQNMWMKNSYINLAEDAVFSHAAQNLKVIGTGNSSFIKRDTDVSSEMRVDNMGYTISNAEVNMSNSADATLGMLLTQSSLTTKGIGKLTVSNSGNTITNLAAESGNVELSASMDVDSISAKEGKTVTVTGGNTIDMGGGAVSIGTNGTDTDATMTAKNGSALAQLQEDATFTIQDMTLTNTTITAASVNTQVNFIDVTVEGATVLRNMQASMTDANVTTGGSEGVKGVFTASTSLLSGITLAAGSTITVDLGDLSCAYSMDQGKYNLSITLSDFTMLDYTQGIVFAADSWLGQLLLKEENAGVQVSFSEAPAAAAEGGAATGVTYSTGSVGTVIHITGLNVPEPTTATLSLLALAALAARRRRND